MLRRDFLIGILYAPATAAFATMPFKIAVDGAIPMIVAQTAEARGNGGGNGGGGGSGGGRGGGNSGGNGNGGGNGTGGGGTSGNNGNGDRGGGKGGQTNGRGRSDASGQSGKGNAADPGRKEREHDDAAAVRSTGKATVVTTESTIDVRYRNGISEHIGAGRYVMKDAQGRTIINRPATGSDLARLRDMAN